MQLPRFSCRYRSSSEQHQTLRTPPQPVHPAARRREADPRSTRGPPRAPELGRPVSGLRMHVTVCIRRFYGRRASNTKTQQATQPAHPAACRREADLRSTRGSPRAPRVIKRWSCTDFGMPTGAGATQSPKATSRALTALQSDDLAHKSLGAQAADRLPRPPKPVGRYLGFGDMRLYVHNDFLHLPLVERTTPKLRTLRSPQTGHAPARGPTPRSTRGPPRALESQTVVLH